MAPVAKRPRLAGGCHRLFTVLEVGECNYQKKFFCLQTVQGMEVYEIGDDSDTLRHSSETLKWPVARERCSVQAVPMVDVWF